MESCDWPECVWKPYAGVCLASKGEGNREKGVWKPVAPVLEAIMGKHCIYGNAKLNTNIRERLWISRVYIYICVCVLYCLCISLYIMIYDADSPMLKYTWRKCWEANGFWGALFKVAQLKPRQRIRHRAVLKRPMMDTAYVTSSNSASKKCLSHSQSIPLPFVNIGNL